MGRVIMTPLMCSRQKKVQRVSKVMELYPVEVFTVTTDPTYSITKD